jgi:RecB family exonuclease
VGIRADERSPARLVDALARHADDPRAPRAASSVRDATSDFLTRAAPLGEAGTVQELVARVRRFVQVSGLADAVGRRGASREELRALVVDDGDAVARAEALSFGRDRAALDALEVALDALEEGASRIELGGRLEPDTLHALLEDALAEQSVHDGGLRGGAVRVVSMRDLAGLDMDAVVLVGLRDGELPAPPAGDPLLTVSDRLLVARALRAKGARAASFDVDEDTSMGRVAFATGREEEPLVFLLAAAAAEKTLILTRACADADGRPTAASPILEDAKVALAAASASVPEEHPSIEPAPEVRCAAGIEDACRAAVREVATVPPSTRAVDAAREATAEVSPDDDVIGLADLLARVAIERRRIAGMLEPGAIEEDRYAGNLRGAPGLDEAFARLRARPFAATTLEELARCPFQFFAKRGLGLGADAVASDDPDPRQRGTLAHECFEAAIGALVAEGVVPYRKELADRAALVAQRAAASVAERGFRLLPFDPVLLGVARDDTVDKVVRLVRALYLADDGFSPSAVEKVFGEAEDGAWPALVVPSDASGDARGIEVRGRIDLVETRGADVRVADLKSSGADELEKRLQPDRYGATELQLALYAAAAKRAEHRESADARYLSLKDGAATRTVIEKRAGGRNWKADPRDVGDLVDVARDGGAPSALGVRVEALVRRISEGRFEVRPQKGACTYCDYASVCRIPRGAPDASEEESGA